MSEEEILNYLEKVSKEKTIIPLDNYIQGLLDLYNKEKEKNKKLEDKIKKAIKEIERRMNLANECIEQEIVIADSDSLNYGRAQAHDVDRVLLMDVVAVADENKIKEILE